MKRNSRSVCRAGLMMFVGALLVVPRAGSAQSAASDSPDIDVVRGYVMDALECSSPGRCSVESPLRSGIQR
jgi:hypothetical protein